MQDKDFFLSPVAFHTVVSDCVESRNGKVLHGFLLHDSQPIRFFFCRLVILFWL